MVVDDTISQALNRIADNQEEMNETLKSILGHYNQVVPVMKRNSDRVEKAHEEVIKEGERVKEVYDAFGVNTQNSFNTEPRN
jgi:methylphosphotriester-DNA--protein-cysteine methyltransferase